MYEKKFTSIHEISKPAQPVEALISRARLGSKAAPVKAPFTGGGISFRRIFSKPQAIRTSKLQVFLPDDKGL